MPEQENASANGQATEKKKTKKPKVNRGPWPTLEAAQANRPEGDTRSRLFRVQAPDGAVSFVWTDGPNNAIVVATKKAGWSSVEHGKAVSKEKVAGLLSQLSPEDRAILIAQYVPPSSKGKK